MSQPYELTTAANGLQILRIPRQGTEAVTAQFFFRAGARYETPETNGLAHFTEHMVFKGGKHYPTALDVADAINRVGGYTNAYTSHEITSFYVKLAADKVGIALDVMSDYLTKPHFDAAELERERGVIIEEINRSQDDPVDLLGELMHRTQYPDHPMGRDVLGPKNNINSFPRQFFVDYVNEYFTPDRGVLVLTGNLSHAGDIDEYVERFSGSSVTTPEPAKRVQAKAFDVLHKPTEQSHLGLAMTAPPYADRAKSPILDVLSTILGGNMSSRLFHEVRERQGLCYTVYSSPDQYLDDGYLYIYAGVPNDKITQALDAIVGQLKRLKDGDLADEDVRIGKESLKGGRALRWEESSALGTIYGLQQLMLGQIQTPAEILEGIEAVTKDEIIGLANEIFDENNLTVGAVGPQDAAKLQPHVTIP